MADEGVPPHRDPNAEAELADGLERFFTPHRLKYIRGAEKPADAGQGEQCPFCRAPGLDDEAGLVVARGELVYAVLNLFPYNTGHMLICPYRHVADLTEATSAESAELAQFTKRLMIAVRESMGAHGFNIGVNAGAVAGAGIPGHLHQHIVPRWGGDSNFFPIVARTKSIPQDLSKTREVIAAAWARASEGGDE